MKADQYILRRLRPSRSLPDFFTLRSLLEKIQEIVSIAECSRWPPPVRVLDAGSGHAPYRSLFSKDPFHYIAADADQVKGVTVLAQSESLPFLDGTFDIVLSNQVIEHVKNPGHVVNELKRLLSDRGYVLLSCPFVWEIHNYPADFWRFSNQALELLFRDMEIIYLEPSTTTAECLIQTFNLYINRNLASERIKRALFRITNSAAFTRLFSWKDSLLPSNYVVLARKFGNANRAAAPARIRMHIDTPREGASLKGQKIKISGWIASDLPVQSVSARIGNTVGLELQHSLPRLDVWRAFPEYRYAHRSGFQGECGVSDVSAGEHNLTVEAQAGGRRISETVTVRI